MYLGGLTRMLMSDMPKEMRARIQVLLDRPDAGEYELKSTYESCARRLVLAKPRDEIAWNPTVSTDLCVGCKVCYQFCPHKVYDWQDGKPVVARPTQCVILCSNCMSKCPAGAITFPPQKEYAQFLRYE